MRLMTIDFQLTYYLLTNLLWGLLLTRIPLTYIMSVYEMPLTSVFRVCACSASFVVLGLGRQCFIIGVLLGDCQPNTRYNAYSYVVFQGKLKYVGFRSVERYIPPSLTNQLHTQNGNNVQQAIRTTEVNAPINYCQTELKLMPKSSNSKFLYIHIMIW